jgi:SAM-dependent methyltransferase
MHPSVIDFAKQVLTEEIVVGATVLEVGSLDVNGSVRSYVQSLCPEMYVGVDMQEGPGVDLTVDCERLVEEMGGDAWDLVISTEMLEHVEDWRTCIRQMAWAVAPGGLLLLTTRSPGFPYHPFPIDKWRFTLADMKLIMDALKLEIVALEDDPSMPGVFVLARKSFKLHTPESMEDIVVAGVTPYG